MDRQRGIALSQLMAWGIVLAFVAIGAMKVIPSLLEYQAILRATKSIAANASAQSTVAQVKVSFSKQMEVDHIQTVTADDLDIYKEDGRIVIAFAYNREIPMFGPVFMLIKYSGSSIGGSE